MKNNDSKFGLELVVGLVTVMTLTLTSSASAQSKSQETEQCSMAVVSRLAGGGTGVCDDSTVQKMAKGGHAFEENQLGLVSILAVGPDYSDKEAVHWF